MNVLDRIIGFFLPVMGMRRLQARSVVDAIRASVDAASLDRLRTRRPQNSGPITESQTSRVNVLTTARSLDRNNSWAHGIADSITNNVVGNGIRLQSRVRTGNGKKKGHLREDINRIIEEDWNKWAEDVGFGEIQRMVARERRVAGEILIARVDSKDPKVPLRLEAIESERLDADFTQSMKKSGNEVIQGVEFRRGTRNPIAYHILVDHPNDSRTTGQQKRQRLDRKRCLHIFRPRRPGEIRGFSDFASVARNLEALQQYLDHELTRARVASAFAIMIKTATKSGGFLKSGDTTSADANLNDTAYLEGGMIFRGGPNDSIEGVGSAIQTTAFEQFVMLILRGVAAGLNVSYEVIARDYTRTNFSSARQSSLEDKKHWEPEQKFLNQTLNEPVFRWFEQVQRERGRLPYRTLPEGGILTEWQTPGWPYIEPKKEIDAEIAAVKAGFMSPQEVAAKHGRDYQSVIEQIAAAKEKAESVGLNLEIFGSDPVEPETDDDEPEVMKDKEDVA